MTDSDEREAQATAAAAVRRLGHALVARQLDEQLLHNITETLSGLSDHVEAAPTQRRLPNVANAFYQPPTKDSSRFEKSLFRESIISGDLNALGVGADVWSEDDVAVMEVVLGPAFEGAPGRSHGGIVAALIDETYGIVLAIHGLAAYTGRLDVVYRAGTPVGEPVTCRCWLERQEGRKLFMRGEVKAGTVLCATSEAVFIVVDPAAFIDPE